MKSKIVRRIVLITMLSLLLVSGVVVFVVNFSVYQADERSLEHIADIYERDMLDASFGDIREALEDTVDSTRVTVFASDGELIADSYGIACVGSDSKSFSDALLGKDNGAVIERKDGDAWLFYSVRVRNYFDDNGFVVLRVGLHYTSNNSFFWISIPEILAALAVVTLLATLFTNKLIKNAISPLEKIQESLENINKGEYKQISYDSKYVEIEKVIKEINNISSRISNSLNYLSYEQKKNNFLLQNMRQGVLALSKKFRIIMANDAVKTIFDNNTTLLGSDIGFLTDDRELKEYIQLAIDEKKSGIYEMELGDKLYRIEIAPVQEKWFEEFRGIAVLVLFTDVTQESNSNRIRSEFFANASHELKTPLTAIKGFSEIMQSTDDEEMRRKCAEEIDKNANRMLELLQDMLKLSKLDAKITEEEPEVIDLRKVSDEVVTAISSLARSRGIRVDVTGEGKIVGQPKLIYDMVTNLAGNAIKYNKDGGSVKISIEEKDGTVIYKVSDTGIGIPAQHQSRIFERFYRIDKGRNRRTMSTGLGLAIVKHIVMQHDAKINMESTEGAGTTFTVSFNSIEEV